MQSLFLYSVYSGQLFFAAAGLFIVVAILDLCGALDQRSLLRRVAGTVMLLAIPLAVLAAPPSPRPIAIAALAIVVAYAFAGFGRHRFRFWLGGAALAACLIVAAFELPHHLPQPRLSRPADVFVIGDSLASGGFGERAPWPVILGRELQVRVTSFAQPSDDTAMALRDQATQLPHVARPGDCVVVEVGGNDMLDGTRVVHFSSALDRLLEHARSGGNRDVVMFELPLLPGRWRYGTVQRAMAAKHGVILIPKRLLARVLVAPGNTSDGIHLTQRGHDALARDLATWFR